MNPEPFSLRELEDERKKLKLGRAPGPDSIPNEIVKLILEGFPELWIRIFNKCLAEGVFPKSWKRQRLVLLRKGAKALDLTSSYRPICLLDAVGKILEGLILQRIYSHFKKGHNLSRNLYGFRKNRSTVYAIKETIRIAKEAREKGGRRKGFCTLIALDIRNAFNSLRWRDIMDAMEERQFPIHIQGI